MWSVGMEAGVTARPTTGERAAVLISCSRVSEGAFDQTVTQVLFTSISIQDAQKISLDDIIDELVSWMVF